jgi:hypothetical protein
MAGGTRFDCAQNQKHSLAAELQGRPAGDTSAYHHFVV